MFCEPKRSEFESEFQIVSLGDLGQFIKALSFLFKKMERLLVPPHRLEAKTELRCMESLASPEPGAERLLDKCCLRLR